MFEFMANAFYCLCGVACGCVAAIILAITILGIYRMGKNARK